MSKSPLQDSEAIVSCEILVNGSPIIEAFQILSVDVDRSFNHVATAELCILNQIEPLGIAEDSSFLPGSAIQISIGYAGKNAPVFKGMIVHLGLKNTQEYSTVWVIQCRDEAVKMTMSRHTNSYQNMADHEVIRAIAGTHSLSCTVNATSTQHKQLVQYQCNDWDFILARAAANGLLVNTHDGVLKVEKPLSAGSSLLTINFGADVLGFDMGIDARQQLDSSTCSSWDSNTLATIKVASSEPSLSPHGNLTGKELSSKLHGDPSEYSSMAPMEQSELKAWADSLLLQSRLARLQGSVTFVGHAAPELNTLVTLTGFGACFNGDALVTSVRHSLREGTWKTTTGFGLPANTGQDKQVVSATPAGGLLPSVQGLQHGVVKQISNDPDNLFRVQVDTPTILGNSDGIWARLVQFSASNGSGSYFYPEIGDEVLLGFVNNDPRFPVIIGMLYGAKNKPPYTPTPENDIKAIVTKNDLKIELNDQDKVITISTPGGNQVVLSDQGHSIMVNDQSGNSIELSGAGIKLNSVKDIVLNASGKISLTALQNISADSTSGDISLNGLNVKASAQFAFSAQGNASAELKSSANTTVKGGMVMIN